LRKKINRLMIRYTRIEDIISGSLHDDLVMMDIDKGKYFALNPVATRIWELLEKELSFDELCKLLLEEYEVEEEQCRREVEEYLEEMVKMKLLRTVEQRNKE